MTAASTPQPATQAAAPLQAPVDTAVTPAANADTVPATPQPAARDASPDTAAKDDDTAVRIKLRPPLLKNIDLRDLSPETQEVLLTKPRGITLLEGIKMMKELKMAAYGDDVCIEQTGDAADGKNWTSSSGSKANVAQKFLVEFGLFGAQVLSGHPLKMGAFGEGPGTDCVNLAA
ncbi:hypothetical protein [Mesobacterium pallidum]|uniref:hypothetical protein n=1 Tax=Mesobacterium pallidum TaxID=2872037 RepID=UPI001EE30C5A|nr:hypothetical protein [Mesobacterium pallidum]